jgi:solute:Na+ symporter, SSS family
MGPTEQGRPEMSQIVVSIGLLLPLAYAVFRIGILRREDYLFYSGKTPFLQTLASIICGNVGIGAFVALFVFTSQSPVIGAAIVMAYCGGLVLCGLMANAIHAAARRTQSHGLIDYLCAAHGISQTWAIWVPVALVFGLRTVIQLLALASILMITFPVSGVVALVLATLVVGSYTSIGGYRVATETDLVQALGILLGVAAIAFVLVTGPFDMPATAPGFWEFGQWSPGFLVAILLFLPFSALLAIDNWQRIATSDNAGNARRAYLMAALICAPLFCTMGWVGWITGSDGGASMAEVIGTFRGLMPFGWVWLADLTIMLAVMSSIDTFVMPLITPMARTRLRMWQIRAAVSMVFLVLGVVAWAMGDIVVSIIAAFNTLVVFLPATYGALVLQDRAPLGAVISMSIGVALTLVLSLVAIQHAALAGFAFSALAYVGLRPHEGQGSRS